MRLISDIIYIYFYTVTAVFCNIEFKLDYKSSSSPQPQPSGEKDDFKGLNNVKYCDTISSACLNADLVILHTEWNDFKLLNFKKLVKKQKFKIYDMRNMYSTLKMKKLKIKYFSVGR